MAFTTFDEFAPINATFSTYCRRFHTLAVNRSGAWLRLTSVLNTHLFTQGGIDLLPDPCLAPPCKMVIDTVVIRILFGQQFPLTPCFIDVQDGVHHFSPVQFARA